MLILLCTGSAGRIWAGAALRAVRENERVRGSFRDDREGSRTLYPTANNATLTKPPFSSYFLIPFVYLYPL